MSEIVSTEEEVLRVSASTSPKELAAAIAHACYEGNPPKLRAIGAGSVNQAMKGLAIARQYVGPKGMDLTVRPGFASVEINGDTVSSMTFRVVIES